MATREQTKQLAFNLSEGDRARLLAYIIDHHIPLGRLEAIEGFARFAQDVRQGKRLDRRRRTRVLVARKQGLQAR